MKCPKCKLTKTEIRTHIDSRTTGWNMDVEIFRDVWRCLNCGHLWYKDLKIDRRHER